MLVTHSTTDSGLSCSKASDTRQRCREQCESSMPAGGCGLTRLYLNDCLGLGCRLLERDRGDLARHLREAVQSCQLSSQ
jgi:hypothetical protein